MEIKNWTFTPAKPRATPWNIFRHVILDADTTATEAIRHRSVLYVRGVINQGRNYIRLNSWHKAVNNAS